VISASGYSDLKKRIGPVGPDRLRAMQHLVHHVRAIGSLRRGTSCAQRGEGADATIANRVIEEGAAEWHDEREDGESSERCVRTASRPETSARQLALPPQLPLTLVRCAV